MNPRNAGGPSKKKRKKIPLEIEAKVRWLSEGDCCACGKPGKHTHHLDGDPSNNDIDNLAWLCFSCHDDAESQKGLGKKLSEKALRVARKAHYARIEARRGSPKQLQRQKDLRLVQATMETLDIEAIEAFIIQNG